MSDCHDVYVGLFRNYSADDNCIFHLNIDHIIDFLNYIDTDGKSMYENFNDDVNTDIIEDNIDGEFNGFTIVTTTHFKYGFEILKELFSIYEKIKYCASNYRPPPKTILEYNDYKPLRELVPLMNHLIQTLWCKICHFCEEIRKAIVKKNITI